MCKPLKCYVANYHRSRQSTTDKIGSSVKPDSQKSTLEQGTDSLKSTADSVAGSVQPGSYRHNIACGVTCIH